VDYYSTGPRIIVSTERSLNLRKLIRRLLKKEEYGFGKLLAEGQVWWPNLTRIWEKRFG